MQGFRHSAIGVRLLVKDRASKVEGVINLEVGMRKVEKNKRRHNEGVHGKIHKISLRTDAEAQVSNCI